MSKVAVVYWSGTGNTEMMAQKVAEGAKEAGAEVSVLTCADFSADDVDAYDAIAFGEWMRTWEESCKNDGAELVCDSVICADAPDDEAEAACIALGKALC